jgi:hypothetical protein
MIKLRRSGKENSGNRTHLLIKYIFQVVSKLYLIAHLGQKPVIFIFFTKLNSSVSHV